MKSRNLIVIVALLVSSVIPGLSQSIIQYSPVGQICAGTNVTFQYFGSCTSLSWQAIGGQVVSTDPANKRATLKWTTATTTAQVNVICGVNSASLSPLTIYAVGGSPTITISGPNSICSANTATYTASITSGGTSPGFQWKVNNVIMLTTPTASYSPSPQLSNGDIVTCTLTSSQSCLATQTANSNSITVAVTTALPLSVSVGNPGTLCANQTGVTFTASVINGSSPVYTWYRNGALADNEIAGNTSTYRPHTPMQNGEKVKCQVSASGCLTGNPAMSPEITITVQSTITPSVSINYPGSVCAGQATTFSASSPQGITSYSWTVTGTPTPPGTQPTYSPTLNPGDIVNLTVGVSGTCVSPLTASSSTPSNLVKPSPNNTITAAGGITRVCSTCTAGLSAATGAGYSYQWRKNGAAIGGATASTYTASQSGNYSCDVTLNGCMLASNVLAITINSKPVANAGQNQTLVLPTNSTTLSGSASDTDVTDVLTYTWTQLSGPSTATITNPNSLTPGISDLIAGTYVFQLQVSDGLETGTSTVTIQVNYPPNNYNRIVQTDVLIPSLKTEAQVRNPQITVPDGELAISWNYYNGLGNAMQTVGQQASPLSKDITQPLTYDLYGRNYRKYLPAVVNETTGYLKVESSILDPATGAYIGALASVYNDAQPFSETRFEFSPMDRPSKVYGPGIDWTTNDKPVEYQYLVNRHSLGASLTDEKVVDWVISGGMPVRATPLATYVEANGFYSTGRLVIRMTKDEQGNQAREYFNSAGQLILRKTQVGITPTSLNATDQWASTYYVYDDFGNLRFVLQPNLSSWVHTLDTNQPFVADLNSLAYQYTYDSRQRMATKKAPGGGLTYLVYDNLDRLVMTQDANQRVGPYYWTFVKYDQLNRPMITGIKDTTAALTQAAMQSGVDSWYAAIPTKPWRTYFESYIGSAAPRNVFGYSNTSYPVVTVGATLDVNKYLTVNYYDNYDFNDGVSAWVPSDVASASVNNIVYAQDASASVHTVGLVTGTLTKALDATPYWLKAINYYDDHSRMVQTIRDHHRSGTIRNTMLYDFPGTMLRLKTAFSETHNSVTTTQTVVRTFDYDHSRRLVNTWHQFNSGANILISHLTYNEIGQVIDKKLHSTDAISYKQSMDYRYNVRGWLTSINNSQLTNDGALNDDTGDLFGMELAYNKAFQTGTATGNTAQWNGNITAAKWSQNLALGAVKDVAYNYKYDGANRLTDAFYFKNTGSWTNPTNAFDDKTYQYDVNGNITSFVRNGATGASIDNLLYTYTQSSTPGNQLVSVADSGTDKAKGFSDGATLTTEYTYDPNGNMTVDQNKGIAAITYNFMNLPATISRGASTVNYLYDAAGRKLSEITISNNVQTRTDYVGEFVFRNDLLLFANHEEGRVVVSSESLTASHDGSNLSNLSVYTDATLSNQTVNGETYVKSVATAVNGYSGIKQIGGTIPVQAGEVYRVRVKGYAGGTNKVFLWVVANLTQNFVWPGISIPMGAASESWVEQTVTITAGVTSMQIGLLYNQSVAVGEAFYLNEFQVVKVASAAAEYQYYLRDHQGNVRLTFTSQPVTKQFTAGFESANQTTEAAAFQNYPNSAHINNVATNAHSGTSSEYLNGSSGGQVGVAKSLSVMPGDVVTIQAYAKYTTATGTTSNLAAFATALLGAFQLPAPVAGETATAASAINSYGALEAAGSGNGTTNHTDPMVFATILVFDRNYTYKDAAYKQLDASGTLSATYAIKEPGYVYVYISNEEATLRDVYFDDVTITQVASPVIQSQDYYPFGLTFNSYQRDNVVSNKYLYNDKESQDDLGLGWLDYGARMYQPELGRWSAIDALTEEMPGFSPYNYVFNNPVGLVDPFGLDPRYDFASGQYYEDANNNGYMDANEETRSWDEVQSFYGLQFGQEVWNKHAGEETGPNTYKGEWLPLWNPNDPDGFIYVQNQIGKRNLKFRNVGQAQKDKLERLGETAPAKTPLNWTDAAAGVVNIFGGANDIGLYQMTKGYKVVSLASKAEYLAARSLSTKLGVVGLAITGYDIYDKGINTGRTLDLVMGGVAFIPVFGWAVSGTYFVANLVTIGVTGQSIGDHIQGAVTGENGTKAWKPW